MLYCCQNQEKSSEKGQETPKKCSRCSRPTTTAFVTALPVFVRPGHRALFALAVRRVVAACACAGLCGWLQ